ncbi:MAG: molybdenum cofactor guanylyltransferase [Acidobacteria bacterium]|nr:molybdenum cofactor guanylyltransferase [Acidobacteriota bacterium]
MWSAAILAGGQATRFGGRDKGSLVVDGDTIRARQLAVLSQIAEDILIVGLSAAPAVPTAFAVRAVPDRLPGCGPLGGLHTALCEARGNATVIIACDMPFVAAPFLAHLLALTREADAVVPATVRGYHPLCAAYTRACAEPAARRLAAGRLKMADLLEDVRVRVVPAEEMRAFGDPDTLVANVNTPGEFRDLEALHGHKP